jgi:D-3-phosphoglycerate dehydrogenase
MREAGLQVTLGRDRWDDPGRPMTTEELIAACSDADAVTGVSRDSYQGAFMRACPNLKIISKVGVGVEKIDLATATDLGILVTNTPVEEGIKAVAEHAVTLMLALSHTIKQLEQVLRSSRWRGPDTSPANLFGKKIGFLGFGRIAREVAHRLKNWDVTMVAYDPYVDQEQAASIGVSLCSLDEVLSQSDIISVHLVVTRETRDLLGAEQFSLMRPGALIVNTSRGEVIDEDALANALASGHIKGAGLDVFKEEPPDLSHPLFQLPNVIATPHAAGFAAESIYANAIAAAHNIVDALQGRIPQTVVNPAAIPKWQERWS